MIILDPGGPSRPPSAASQEYRRAQGGSRAAKPASGASFTLDLAEHGGTITAVMGDDPKPVVPYVQPTAVVFTLNQDSITFTRA